ncbi:Bifunctional riboflavin kinase/FMN phosphatase [Bienertia sinuspersici]
MEVIAIPSIPKQSHLYTMADEVISSLFDLRPEQWNLPPFDDWIEGTLPIEPWHIGGPVIKGFGPNLSTEGYSSLLSEYPSGVYFGWAGVAKRGIYKMVMSIGWNPYFDNAEKTIEPWLLHEFEDDFYGEELRLVVVAKIHEDGRIAESALELPTYSKYKDDMYLKSLLEMDTSSNPS